MPSVLTLVGNAIRSGFRDLAVATRLSRPVKERVLWDFSTPTPEVINKFRSWKTHSDYVAGGTSLCSFELISANYKTYGPTGITTPFHTLRSLSKHVEQLHQKTDPEGYKKAIEWVQENMPVTEYEIARAKMLKSHRRKLEDMASASEEERKKVEEENAAEEAELKKDMLITPEQLVVVPTALTMLQTDEDKAAEWSADPDTAAVVRPLPDASKPPEVQEYTYASWTGRINPRLAHPRNWRGEVDRTQPITEEPGFAAISSLPYSPPLRLDMFNAVQIKMRSSAHRFAFLLEPVGYSEGDVLKAYLRLPRDEWVIVEIPIEDFALTNNGVLQMQEPQESIPKVTSCGFTSMGELGEYRIDVEWIKAVRAETHDERMSRLALQ